MAESEWPPIDLDSKMGALPGWSCSSWSIPEEPGQQKPGTSIKLQPNGRKPDVGLKPEKSGTRATIMPALQNELVRFRAIARDMQHEASTKDGALFKAEQRQQLRRLAGL